MAKELNGKQAKILDGIGVAGKAVVTAGLCVVGKVINDKVLKGKGLDEIKKWIPKRQLIGGRKMSERFPGIDWFCDRCNSYLNDQEGFDDHHYVWKCTECGHKNSISSDSIYESREDYENYELD